MKKKPFADEAQRPAAAAEDDDDGGDDENKAVLSGWKTVSLFLQKPNAVKKLNSSVF